MKYTVLSCLIAATCITAVRAAPPEMPMVASQEDSAQRRWLQKKVLASRLLDDMENVDQWKIGRWAGGEGNIELTTERHIDGQHSLRFRSRTLGRKPSADGGVFGSTSAVRTFDEENFRQFNRLSFWVYPDMPGFHAVSLSVRLGNSGEKLGRDTHHFLLKNFEWNQVVWEFPDVARDRVTEIAFTYVMNGRERGAAEWATFDIDHVELQRAEPDHYEGWNIPPGQIAFSHTGYASGAPKIALASDVQTHRFEVVRADSGKVVFPGIIEVVETEIGEFQKMEFSKLREPGSYFIRAGDVETRPFRIDDHVWRDTIWKAINFFYVERCGTAIPGVHAVCHEDWQGEHEGKRIVINGGWHDAGDLSQGLVNTSEAAYAMFDLAMQERRHGPDEDLYRRLIDEAKWGLDWVMKTSFRDGHRIWWATHRFWTNGIIGDVDDVTAKATRNPAGGFYAAAVEAIAFRALHDDEPDLAKRALALAREDWQFGVSALPDASTNRTNIETASIAALASIELYQATGEARYGEKAKELARYIVSCQRHELLPSTKAPLTGLFYRTPARRSRQTYQHRGHEQAPIVALARLCELFPDDEAWMDWYSAVVLHSEYFQLAMARWTAPYHLLPNSLRHIDEQRDEDAREQIANGFDVGGGYFIRVFPVHVPHTFRGNYGTVLSQAKAISTAAHLRRSLELAHLCQDQLHWIVGRNPFGQSTMYGEGYDFAPQYTARSGDIVGSLPVGMKSLGNRDLPYWPATNIWNYKEVWVHPVSRWLWLMADLERPAMRPEHALRLSLDQKTGTNGQVALSLTAEGSGQHEFLLRSFNLQVKENNRSVQLMAGQSQTIVWQCQTESPNQPWVAVLVPDGRLDERVEATGCPPR